MSYLLCASVDSCGSIGYIIIARDIVELLAFCITAGWCFSVAAVRYGRVPKRSLSADDPPIGASNLSELQRNVEKESTVDARHMELYDTILSIFHSHAAHCDETEDKVLSLNKCQVSLVGQSLGNY